MNDLNGKRIMITGGASGMGEAMVKAFPKLGAKIVFFDVNEEAGKQLAKETKTTFIRMDVSQKEDVEQSFEEAINILGGIDVLVNCAGIAPTRAAEDIELEEWNKVMDINSTGTFLTNTIAFHYMKETGGNIINFSSAGGIQGYKGKAHYGASKGAVTAWTRSVAMEWGQYNVRVNMIAPAIWTPMYDKTRSLMTSEQLTAHDAFMKSSVPLGGKLGNPETDFIPVMAFMCSDASKFITGQVISVDGGALMVR